MEYLELRAENISGENPLFDELAAFLAEIGFDSFNDDGNVLLAYIPSRDFEADKLHSEIPQLLHDRFSFTWQIIPDQNWNAVWEENFQPVFIDDRCYIRAPFHPVMPGAEVEVVIEPKMSFGTAHHETTALMIRYSLDIDFSNKTVLDTGCGTGVLAILAAKRNAKAVDAIDIDEWAYNNSIENTERNKTPQINVYLGDASLLIYKEYDIILANINRNILLNDIPVYEKSLNKDGLLYLSGFYLEDLDAISKKCVESGLQYVSHKEENRWVAACFMKV